MSIYLTHTVIIIETIVLDVEDIGKYPFGKFYL